MKIEKARIFKQIILNFEQEILHTRENFMTWNVITFQTHADSFRFYRFGIASSDIVRY